MDPSSSQHQAMATHSLEDILTCPKQQQDQRKLSRPQPEHLKCPRCNSSNTKFCYYNNYSLTQPRYFCKACRRYWTKGGSLRNVPVGGGCRKNNKRSSSSSSSSSKKSQDHHQILNTTNSNPLLTFPSLTYDTNDLTLAFGRLHKQPTRQLGFDDHETSFFGNPNTTNPHCDIIGNLNTTSSNPTPGFIDALRSGFLDPSSGFHNFYSGFGSGSIEDQVVESGGADGNCLGGEEVVLPYDHQEMSGATTTLPSTITTPTKQEYLLKDRSDVETRVLWNFPWQFNGDGNMGVVDSGRDYWNGSSWHNGLVNSPLM